MEVDAEAVIKRLVNRIAELEYQLVVTQAALSRFENQDDSDTAPPSTG